MAGSPMYPGAQAQNGIPVSNTTWHTVLVPLQMTRSQGSIFQNNKTGTKDMHETCNSASSIFLYQYRDTQYQHSPMAYFSRMQESISLLDDIVEF